MLFAISELTLAVVVAGATLLGSAVGALGTALVTFRLEKRRQDFINSQEADREKRELRQAGRLVVAELEVGRSRMEVTQAQKWWWRSDDPLAINEWMERKGLLAARLDSSSWAKTAEAFEWFAAFNRFVRQAEIDRDREDPDSRGSRSGVNTALEFKELETALKSSSDALSALSKALGLPSPSPVDETPYRPHRQGTSNQVTKDT